MEILRWVTSKKLSAVLTSPCPCCGGSYFKTLVDFGQVPVSGLFHKFPKQETSCAPLAVEFCPGCAFARKRKFLGIGRDYRKIERGTAGQLPCYTDWILQEAKKRSLPDGLVVEIGCNDGTFLRESRKVGFSRLLGVEPSPTLAAGAKATGIEVMADYFGMSLAEKILDEHGPATLIICRHTLEHVPDPFSFLEATRRLLAPEGSLYLECPDSQTLFGEARFHEIWDEHENYFFGDTLLSLLKKAKLSPFFLARQKNRDALNLCVFAGCGEPKNDSPGVGGFSSHLQAFEAFPERLVNTRSFLRNQLSHNCDAPLYGLGAGHPQTNYLIFTDLGRTLSGLVDDDPGKHGLFVNVPNSVPIISTQGILEICKPVRFLKTAFAHPDWMSRIQHQREQPQDQWIEPYPSK